MCIILAAFSAIWALARKAWMEIRTWPDSNSEPDQSTGNTEARFRIAVQTFRATAYVALKIARIILIQK